MDNSFDQQKPDTQHPGLLIFDNILNWLAGLIHLTEEEQIDAGIYLDD